MVGKKGERSVSGGGEMEGGGKEGQKWGKVE